MADTSSLFTTVMNPTSQPRVYGYLGYHGRTVAGGGQYSQIGDLVTFASHGGLPTRQRQLQAIQRDLLATPPRLRILQTPAVILEDTVTSAIKQVKLTSGTLGVTDPSWGPYIA